MTTEKIDYSAYVAMTVTNLQGLASAPTDPFAGWQSDRVDNLSSLKAVDFEVQIILPTANTAAANDKAVYIYLVPWIYDGSIWTPAANFGTITRPTGVQGVASISDPNSMKGAIAFPYKAQQQPIDGHFCIARLCDGNVPDGWSLAIRNCTGAAFAASGCVVAYRPIFYTSVP